MGNTPNIRFKGFTDDWEQRKLSECAGFRRGSFPQPYGNKEWYDGEGAMPFVQVADVADDMKLVDDTKQKISKLAQPMSVYADKGSVLVTLQGSIGRVAITQYGAFVDRTVLIFDKYNQDIDKTFWAYIIKEKFIDEARKAPGGTIKTITKEALSDFDLMLPNYDEQKKLGAFLVSIDNLITLHQRKCDETKKLKKFMLQKMFPKKNEKKPEIRFAGFTDDWEQRKFPEFVSFYNGLTYTPNDIQEMGTLVLRSSNVKNGEIVDADNVYVNDKVATSENVQVGDIIVVVRNGSRALIGKHAQIKASMPNTVIGAFMSGIRSGQSSFVNALLDTSAFENEIAKNMGATINQITGYMFSKMEFMVPSEEEQQQIGQYFSNLDHLITLHQRKCDEIKEIKKFMLQNMFPQKG